MNLADVPVYEPHELCAMFPRLGGAEYDALRDSIAAHGLIEPITLLGNKILDGLHRYTACRELGVVARFAAFDGADPLAYVLGKNLHRRHLTQGQQAMIAALAMELTGKIAGTEPVTEATGNLAASPSEIPTGKIAAPTIEKAAAAAGVSERTLRHARGVAKQDPELAQDVAKGKVSLPAAVEMTTGKRPGRGGNLAARVQELEEELERVREGAQEAVEQAEAARAVLEGDPAKTILQLRQQLRVTEQRVDELLRENGELKAEVKRLQRKLGIRK